jgi:hypothetical protein
VHTIVREQGFVLTDRIRQLRCITVPELPCFLCRDDSEPTRTYSLSNQYVHIFIKIQLDEKTAHGSVTKGSINSSGIRLRAMCVSISA